MMSLLGSAAPGQRDCYNRSSYRNVFQLIFLASRNPLASRNRAKSITLLTAWQSTRTIFTNHRLVISATCFPRTLPDSGPCYLSGLRPPLCIVHSAVVLSSVISSRLVSSCHGRLTASLGERLRVRASEHASCIHAAYRQTKTVKGRSRLKPHCLVGSCPGRAANSDDDDKDDTHGVSRPLLPVTTRPIIPSVHLYPLDSG